MSSERPATGVASATRVVPPVATPAAEPQVLIPASFAYVSLGEVYYSRALGAAARQLTQTGGRVDAIYWAPDGGSIVYKQAAVNTQVGDLHEVDLQGHERWSLSTGAVAFAFSPDGSSYALAIPSVSGGTVASYRVVFGRHGDQPSGNSVAVTALERLGNGQTAPVTAGILTEHAPVLWAEMPFSIGLRWSAVGIHFQCSIHCGYDIDPGTMATAWDPDLNPFLPARAYVGPQVSAFALAPPTITASGARVSIPGAASVVLLSVSPDGQTALANYARADGGHGIAAVRPDGTVTQITADSSSIFGLFQPISSG